MAVLEKLAMRWLASLAVVLASCQSPSVQTQSPARERLSLASSQPAASSPHAGQRAQGKTASGPSTTAPETRRRASRVGGGSVRLEGQDVLVIRGAIGQVNGLPITYIVASDQPDGRPATQPATSSAEPGQELFLLRSSVPSDPLVRGVIRYEADRTQARIVLSCEVPLPQINLLANTLVPMLPVRLQPPEVNRVIQSALGPIAHGSFDALYDPHRDWAFTLQGSITYQCGSDGVVVMASLPASSAKSQTVLSVTSQRDFLQRTRGLTSPLGEDFLPEGGAPAGWTSCAAAGSMDEPAVIRNVDWLAMNLKPWGARLVQSDAMSPRCTDRIARADLRLEPCPHGRADSPLVTLPATDPAAAWTNLQKEARSLFASYWAHGILRYQDPGPVFFNGSLSLEQARLWASLLGLGGQVLMLGDALHTLPVERADLIRKICPPAPIRAVNLFEHTLPVVWDLKLATSFARWDVVGVFNWSDAPMRHKLWLDRLDLDADATHPFAVFDVWQGQLLAITTKHVELNVPPTACRVVALVPLSVTRPTLLGSNRHITHGGIDLADVYFSETDLAMHGKSDIVAGVPYELRICVPPGPDSFEIADVQAESLPVQVRRHGPIRFVTLQSDQSRNLAWTITFTKASQTFDPPASPARLEAKQTTRGVRLTWNATDDRAVFYRVYRDGERIAEVDTPPYWDSGVVYDATYLYKVTAVDWAERESKDSAEVPHRTPIPASTNLTQLLPIRAAQDALAMGTDQSVQGNPLRVAGRRYHVGLGTCANARLRYFLGGGYATFTGEIGIDDEMQGKGSAVFKVIGDGKELFTSEVKRGGQPSQSFRVDVHDVTTLELLVTDAGDGTEGDHADWGNPHLLAAAKPKSKPTPPIRPAGTTRPAS